MGTLSSPLTVFSSVKKTFRFLLGVSSPLDCLTSLPSLFIVSAAQEPGLALVEVVVLLLNHVLLQELLSLPLQRLHL